MLSVEQIVKENAFSQSYIKQRTVMVLYHKIIKKIKGGKNAEKQIYNN